MGKGTGRPLRAAAIAMMVATLSMGAITAAQAAPEAAATPAPAEAAASAPAWTVKVDIPKVEAVNSSIDDATLKAIFSGDVAGHADALAHLTADSIKVPELTVTIGGIKGADGKDTKVTARYDDIELQQVSDGVAATASFAKAESSEPDVSATYGKMTASHLDIGALLAFAGLIKPDDPDAMKTIYESAGQQGLSIKTKGGECSVANVRFGAFKARPLKVSVSEMVHLLDANKDTDKPSPEVVAKLVAFVADASSAVETAPTAVEGINCSATDDSGKPVSVGIEKVGIGAFHGPIYPEVSLDNLIVKASDGSASLASLMLKPIDYSGPIAAVQAAGSDLDDAWFQDHGRELIPDFGGFSLKNATIDMPDTDNPGMRIKGSVASLDLSMADFVNGVPTTLSSSIDHLVVDLPKQSDEMAVKQLRAMGIEQLDLGYQLAMKWDQQSQTITVDKFGVSGGNLGSLVLAAALGNATRDLFGNDIDAAKAAGMGLTLKSFGIDATDEGAGDLIFKQLAAESGTSPEAERTAISGMAQGMALAILGGSTDTMGFASAIGTFLNGGHALSATITAKQDGGLPLTTLEGLTENPTALAGKFTVEATAK